MSTLTWVLPTAGTDTTPPQSHPSHVKTDIPYWSRQAAWDRALGGGFTILRTDESGLGRIWGWLSYRSGLEEKGVLGGRPHGDQRLDVRAERLFKLNSPSYGSTWLLITGRGFQGGHLMSGHRPTSEPWTPGSACLVRARCGTVLNRDCQLLPRTLYSWDGSESPPFLSLR